MSDRSDRSDGVPLPELQGWGKRFVEAMLASYSRWEAELMPIGKTTMLLTRGRAAGVGAIYMMDLVGCEWQTIETDGPDSWAWISIGAEPYDAPRWVTFETSGVAKDEMLRAAIARVCALPSAMVTVRWIEQHPDAPILLRDVAAAHPGLDEVIQAYLRL